MMPAEEPAPPEWEWKSRMYPAAPSTAEAGEEAYRHEAERLAAGMLGAMVESIERQLPELSVLHGVHRPASPTPWERKESENKRWVEEMEAEEKRRKEMEFMMP